MSKTSVSTLGANPEKAPNDTSPGFDGTIAEKFNRAVAGLSPKDNPATGAANTAEKFLRRSHLKRGLKDLVYLNVR